MVAPPTNPDGPRRHNPMTTDGRRRGHPHDPMFVVYDTERPTREVLTTTIDHRTREERDLNARGHYPDRTHHCQPRVRVVTRLGLHQIRPSMNPRFWPSLKRK